MPSNIINSPPPTIRSKFHLAICILVGIPIAQFSLYSLNRSNVARKFNTIFMVGNTFIRYIKTNIYNIYSTEVYVCSRRSHSQSAYNFFQTLRQHWNSLRSHDSVKLQNIVSSAKFASRVLPMLVTYIKQFHLLVGVLSKDYDGSLIFWSHKQ